MRGLYLAAVWLHVLAAMTWVGGMVLFVAAVMPYFRHRPAAERTQFLHWFTARFRAMAWICFTILAATGTFILWARGVVPGDFLRPEWRAGPFGHFIIVKISLLAVAMAISVAHERLASLVAARWMGRSLLLVGLTIVAAAVVLVRS
jgi:uncharacterized membrane protein